MQCLSNVLTRGHVSSTHCDAWQAAQTSLVTFAIIHGGHLVDHFNTPTFHHRKFRSCLRGSSHHGRTKLPACVWWSRRTAYLRANRFLNVVRSYSCSGILYTEEYYTTTTRQGALEQRWCSGWSYIYAVLLCLNLWSSSSLHQLGTPWPIRHDKSERIPQPNRLPCIIFCVFALCFGI